MRTGTKTQSIFQKLFPKTPDRREQFTLRETDNSLLVGTRSLDDSLRDRYSYDRTQVLADCLDAWRYNPLARRIVELTSQYVVGGGMLVRCEHAPTQAFIDAFWQEHLNRMDVRLVEMCDELTRSGNLFLLLSTDPSGMSYLRVVPAADIESIQSAPNDIEQEQTYTAKTDLTSSMAALYPAYDPSRDAHGEDGHFQPVMLHYAVNRPAGAQWGEPDMAPLLRWLSRYAAWLEDRVRLNRFRNAFMYVVKARFSSESARQARQSALAANPPAPGSVLVTDESEDWSVISPRLEALDASTDGLAVKKMIAAGAGVPLHFLAEPESSTRTTAEASGSPTFRKFEERQRFFQWMLADLLHVVLERKRLAQGSSWQDADTGVQPNAALAVHAADISARDNPTLAKAGLDAAQVMDRLVERGLIDGAEMLRVVYRFLGEAGDVPALMKQAEALNTAGAHADGRMPQDSAFKPGSCTTKN